MICRVESSASTSSTRRFILAKNLSHLTTTASFSPSSFPSPTAPAVAAASAITAARSRTDSLPAAGEVAHAYANETAEKRGAVSDVES